MKSGIMFHHFHGQHHPVGQGSLSSDQFYQLLNKHSNIISADEWYDKFKKNKLKEESCISFDDNLKSQFDVAFPVLKAMNLKAFWFIYTSPLTGIAERVEMYRYFRTTQFSNINEFYRYFDEYLLSSPYHQQVKEQTKEIDFNEYLSEWPFYSYEDRKFRFIRDKVLGEKKYFNLFDTLIDKSNIDKESLIGLLWMNKENIHELHAKGQFIGLHSHTHPTRIEDFSHDDIFDEYSQNKTVLEELLGEKIFSMAHPCNSYNKDALNILQQLGIKIGFRSNPVLQKYTALELPRIDHTLLLKQ